MNRHTTLFTRALDVALQNGYVFQLMEACEGMEMSKEARFIMRKCKARAEFYNKMTDFRQLLDKFVGAFFKMLADEHVQRMLAPNIDVAEEKSRVRQQQRAPLCNKRHPPIRSGNRVIARQNYLFSKSKNKK